MFVSAFPERPHPKALYFILKSNVEADSMSSHVWLKMMHHREAGSPLVLVLAIFPPCVKWMDILQLHSLDWSDWAWDRVYRRHLSCSDVLELSDVAHRFSRSLGNPQGYVGWKNQIVVKILQDWQWVIIYQKLPIGPQRILLEHVSNLVLLRPWPKKPQGNLAILALKKLFTTGGCLPIVFPTNSDRVGLCC